MYVDPEYVHDYLETPLYDRLTFALGQSLLEIVRRLTAGSGIVYVAIVVHKKGNNPKCYIPTNGFETSNSMIENREDRSRDYNSSFIEHINNLAKRSLIEEDIEPLFPVSDCYKLYSKEDEDTYLIPISPLEGCFRDNLLFHKVCEEFAKRWGNFLNQKSFDEIDDFWDVAARDTLGNFDFVIKEAAWKVLLEELDINDWNQYDGEGVLSYINGLSSQPYEGRPCKGVLAVKRKGIDNYNLQIKLKEEECFFERSYRENRKLLEMTDAEHPLLIEEGTIVGVGDIELCGTRIRFLGNGKWTFEDRNGSIIFRNDSGSISIIESPELSGLIYFMSEEFGDQCDYDLIKSIATEASKQRHGTGIIVSDHALDEAMRLFAAGRAIAIDPVFLGNHLETVRLASQIDGAFIINEYGTCYAIGAIADGEAIIEGTSSRGARYNSLANYAAWRQDLGEKCVSIIISEDGGIDIAISHEEKERRRISNG